MKMQHGIKNDFPKAPFARLKSRVVLFSLAMIRPYYPLSLHSLYFIAHLFIKQLVPIIDSDWSIAELYS